jgi:hypothetical protein
MRDDLAASFVIARVFILSVPGSIRCGVEFEGFQIRSMLLHKHVLHNRESVEEGPV